MVVGALTSYSPQEVEDRYEKERRDRIVAGLEGLVQLETTVNEKARMLFFCGVSSYEEIRMCITSCGEDHKSH